MPGLGGITFDTVNKYPVVDRGGLDAAFLGYGSQKVGVYKRVDGGAPMDRPVGLRASGEALHGPEGPQEAAADRAR